MICPAVPDGAAPDGLFRLRLLHAGTFAVAADRAWTSRPWVAGACFGQQVCRPSATLPPKPDLRARWARSGSLDAGGLGGQIHRPSGTAGRRHPLPGRRCLHRREGGGMCWRGKRSLPTTPRLRCSPPAQARPKPPGFGPMAATNALGAAPSRPPASPLSSDQWRTMARYRFSSDRKGEHPKDHLAKYSGWMHVPSHGLQANHCRATDGYAGFEDLYRNGAIREVACMAHVRRKFVPSRACKHALPGNGCA